MKKGFTLIEVLISVLIVSITAIALLQLQESGIKIFQYNLDREGDYKNSSAIFSSLDIKYDHLTKSVYDVVKMSYPITNLEIKKKLEEQKIDFRVIKNEKDGEFPITLENYQVGSVWIIKVQK
jgi:prepilin-type N-terminal cleavage/methylation domain-containing protein